MDRPIVLATDLDGTFLGGSASERQQLYDLIRAHRASIRLIFVTGRSYPSVLALLEDEGIPAPECMICDVGTSVLDVHGRAFNASIEADIAARWADGHARLAATIDPLPGLTRQKGTGPFRRSYYYSDIEVALAAREHVTGMGYDGLISHGCYLDVLPAGVNKGWALHRLIEAARLPADRILTAGDTMNDWAMLTAGLPAVAVGNAEPELLDALPQDNRIYRAQAHGAAGILEALSHHPALK